MDFRYVQNIDSDEPVMLLNRHIGFDEEDGMGIDGSLFQEELMALDNMGKKRIQVWINSTGGIVMDGYNIISAIQKTKTPVDTYCMGMAASIAGVIFQSGRKRIMADYGILMYHNPYAGDTTESPLLDSIKESLNTLIRAKCGMSEDQTQRMMDRTSFIQADEALQMKLCDQVESTVKLNTKYFPRTANKEEGVRFYQAANKVLNKIFNTTTLVTMTKVTNKLKLNDSANEDSIVAAIEAVENRAISAEKELETVTNKSKAEMDKMKADMEEMENKLSAMKKEYDDCKNKLDTEMAAKNKIAEEALEAKAETLVQDAVKAGKIKNDAKVIEGFKAQAKANFDNIKTMLDGIAINRTANQIKIDKNKTGEVELKANVGLEMANISNRLREQK